MVLGVCQAQIPTAVANRLRLSALSTVISWRKFTYGFKSARCTEREAGLGLDGLYCATRSTQIPPCKHGVEPHSSTLVPHVPGGKSAYPTLQVHVYAAMPCMHVELCRHGVAAHSSRSVSHRSPAKPAKHLHRKLSAALVSSHVPPDRQGEDAHSSMSSAQLYPANPTAHTQAYTKTASTQVAPFLQGYEAHSSRPWLHLAPDQPSAHVHVTRTLHAAFVQWPSTQAAPFMHGEEAHSSIGLQVLPWLLVP